MKARIEPAYVAGFVAFAITALVSHLRATPYNNYVLLAQALLHGHAWIDWPGNYIDALEYGGRYYVIEAPMPALLLLPYVAIAGLQANQTILAAVLAAVAVAAAWRIGARFGLSTWSNAWICAFFLAGTDLLWCAMLGDVWFIAHVSAACFTMLAIAELAGKRRGWIVALCAAAAVESRFSMVAALPVYAGFLAFPRDPERQDRLMWFASVLIAVGALWIFYNRMRWGTWADIGYTTWYHQDQAGSPTGSPFRFAYLPNQLWSLFVQMPTLLSTFPWLRPEYSGVALTWTSPALLLALRARRPAGWVAGMWIAALLVAIPSLLYYVNGYAQFGMRHALDFEPFLLVLMMLGVRDRFPKWGYALIVWSVSVGLWGCWYWLTFLRPAQ